MSATPLSGDTRLSALGAGFSSEALGSQGVFRGVLQALSQPARPVAIVHDAEVPVAGHAASAAVLLALLDSECTLWLSPALAASAAGSWLRFHTGCVLVAAPGQARFVWVAAGDGLPALAGLQDGSDAFPDRSATCVVDVQALEVPEADDPGTGAWRLSGPGIAGMRRLRVAGLPQDFERQWAGNHGAFPRGVDLVLATASHIAGLPRTTRIHQPAEEA